MVERFFLPERYRQSANSKRYLLGRASFMNLLARVLVAAMVWLPGVVVGQERPNILVLMAEDLSARVGAFGDPVARTPNLDRLAAVGVRFPNTFTTAGVCAPSRAAFITGVHQITLGAQHMRTSDANVASYLAVPPAEMKAFPELLRRAGYFTFTTRKLDYQFSGVPPGSGPPTIWDTEAYPDVLPELPPDKPFFGLINFLNTHESQSFLPESTTTEFGRAGAERALAARSGLARRTPRDSVVVPPYYPDTPEVRAHIADHYDNVQLMDAQVGQVLARLESLGRLDQTIIIWTTDHGDPFPRAKRELFDSGIRVPMIIRWPPARRPANVEAGAVDNRLVSFVDLAPIILALAGERPPDYLHGRNLLDPGVAPRRYVYASRDRMDEQPDRVRAVRDARFKYLRYFRPGTPGAVHIAYRDQGRIMQALWSSRAAGILTSVQSAWFEPRPTEALYDLETDPHETVNLAGDPEQLAVLSRFRSAYGAWRLRVPDTSDRPEAEMAAEFWPGGRQPVTEPPTIQRDEQNRVTLTAGPGASIEYRLNDGRWRLYTGPLATATQDVITARAVRYGYAVSAEAPTGF
jgi:N-sulfoglucosamine sulfohydrolase